MSADDVGESLPPPSTGWTVYSDGTRHYVQSVTRETLSAHPTFREAMAERDAAAESGRSDR